MEFTIDQALQKGIEAYKSGQAQDADRFYTAILQAQPKHPDANHNMGILAVSVGKIEEALPFFRTALEANSSTAQFWLSYINALIKLGRLADAKSIFDQAKSNDAKGDDFDRLEHRLDAVAPSETTVSQNQDPPNNLLQPLINLYGQEQLQQALSEVKRLLEQFSNSTTLYNIKGAITADLGQLDVAIEAYNKALAIKPDYADAYNNMGNALKEQGKLEEAIEAYNKALAIKPDYAEPYKNMGNALQEQGKPEEAIEAYNKALTIKPDYAKAHYNKAAVLKEQGKLEEAIEAYKATISINPVSADAFNNIGNALKEQGKLDDAVEAYNKALAINPTAADAFNNMGNALKDNGKIEEAIEAYKNALAIKHDYADCFLNLNNLKIQFSQLDSIKAGFSVNETTGLGTLLSQRPKYQIQQAILNFILGKFDVCITHLQKYEVFYQSPTFPALDAKDQVFCNAYFNFLSSLIKNSEFIDNSDCPKIYHVGESHCLSYAHSLITIAKERYVVAPIITFGAKAYHFSNSVENKYKAITKLNLKKIPKNSKVFVSVGEIDCRASEGIIRASDKTGKSLFEVTDETVNGYVEWFLNENRMNRFSYHFFNVPAPTYSQEYSKSHNDKVAKTVSLFNACLLNKTLTNDAKMIDVYSHTTNKNGFSNSLYNCDNTHLDSRINSLIQKQFQV